MPLSSPTKGISRANADAKAQAQIEDLTGQKHALIMQYMTLLEQRPTCEGTAQQTNASSTDTSSLPIASDRLTPPARTLVKKLDVYADDDACTSAPTPKELSSADAEAAMTHANTTLKQHLKLLHDYNEIKDVATGLMGMIAEQRGVRVSEVMQEMGVEGE